MKRVLLSRIWIVLFVLAFFPDMLWAQPFEVGIFQIQCQDRQNRGILWSSLLELPLEIKAASFANKGDRDKVNHVTEASIAKQSLNDFLLSQKEFMFFSPIEMQGDRIGVQFQTLEWRAEYGDKDLIGNTFFNILGKGVWRSDWGTLFTVAIVFKNLFIGNFKYFEGIWLQLANYQTQLTLIRDGQVVEMWDLECEWRVVGD